MKKVILAVVIAGFATSCKKIQAGSNKGALKIEEGANRYSEDEMGSVEHTAIPHVTTPNVTTEAVHKDSTRTAPIQEVTITADSSKTVKPTTAPAENTAAH